MSRLATDSFPQRFNNLRLSSTSLPLRSARGIPLPNSPSMLAATQPGQLSLRPHFCLCLDKKAPPGISGRARDKKTHQEFLVGLIWLSPHPGSQAIQSRSHQLIYVEYKSVSGRLHCLMLN